jgi:P27 family predicted phage terminase small subunit
MAESKEVTKVLGVQDYFNRYKKHLSKIGKLNEEFDIDEVALLKLSEWEKLYQDMRNDCELNGYTQKTQSNYSQIRAEYTIMTKAQDFILAHSQKFGLTPADRSKVFDSKGQKKEKKKFGKEAKMKVG